MNRDAIKKLLQHRVEQAKRYVSLATQRTSLSDQIWDEAYWEGFIFGVEVMFGDIMRENCGDDCE